MHNNSTPTKQSLHATSKRVILDNQHSSGAYPAAAGYSVYNYSWFRDGAFIAEAMSRVGETTSAAAFHNWCRRTLLDRAEHIDALISRAEHGEPVPTTELLPTRFALDGGTGTEDWWDFQLDGYGTWLWALDQHLTRHGLNSTEFVDVIEITARYLVTFGHLACYDWWEEFEEHRHASTAASLAAGLRAAKRMLGSPHPLSTAIDGAIEAHLDFLDGCTDQTGSLVKWHESPLVDGSLLACFAPFEVVAAGSDMAEATYARICAELAPHGGVYRYLGDTFYGGGEWINLTSLLGLYEARTGRNEQAASRLSWIAEQATNAGELPEQVSHHVQEPTRIAEWVERWGTVATPLLWSHAMFLILETELNQQP